eukprot:EG_transcript_14995
MRLPPLLSIRDILRLYGISALPKLSQNFLLDPTILRKLASFCPDAEQRLVIEVGPGPGGLTRAYLERGVQRLLAIEKDERFQPALAMLEQAVEGRLKAVLGDALRVDEAALVEEHFGPLPAQPWAAPGGPLITGNLPFSISGPLLIRWLRLVGDRQGIFACGRGRLELMMQKEVAERMVALPGSRKYGRLSVLCQHLCATKVEYIIPGRCFVPPPDVDAAWVSLDPYPTPRVAAATQDVEQFCTLAFSKSRKVCRTALELSGVPPSLVALVLQSANIGATERFQELPVDVICRMAAVWGRHKARMQDDPYYKEKGRPRMALPRAKG